MCLLVLQVIVFQFILNLSMFIRLWCLFGSPTCSWLRGTKHLTFAFESDDIQDFEFVFAFVKWVHSEACSQYYLIFDQRGTSLSLAGIGTASYWLTATAMQFVQHFEFHGQFIEIYPYCNTHWHFLQLENGRGKEICCFCCFLIFSKISQVLVIRIRQKIEDCVPLHLDSSAVGSLLRKMESTDAEWFALSSQHINMWAFVRLCDLIPSSFRPERNSLGLIGQNGREWKGENMWERKFRKECDTYKHRYLGWKV